MRWKVKPIGAQYRKWSLHSNHGVYVQLGVPNIDYEAKYDSDLKDDVFGTISLVLMFNIAQ